MKPRLRSSGATATNKWRAFETALETLGLKFIQGARFWHILDARGGKDQAVSWLNEQYLQRDGMLPTTLGLGDGPNDAPLLDSVDLAVVIKGINRQGIQLRNDDPERVYHTQQSGPAAGVKGWITSYRPDRPPDCVLAASPGRDGHQRWTATVQSHNYCFPERCSTPIDTLMRAVWLFFTRISRSLMRRRIRSAICIASSGPAPAGRHKILAAHAPGNVDFTYRAGD
ncbi:Putative mannosyl-3-phosphoglycerate phosphatase [Leclercia adecarboxylata]|uniref:Mannosyl-3-phosphoglycerate phosphatase n=1 Tax=Leclercia adecarboxylata TaxID=83655 RepID=A0A4U9I0T9_9ENTR|nr:Putative mannosyl-3-phosphoglycerate phosphatase [Leclercia adecarboxylata]